MSSIYRSEEMCLCQLFLQTESAYTCVAELGELGLVQFRDLNPDTSAFQRKFVNEVRRCDEMERKLRYLEKEIKKDGIPMLDTGENPDAPQPREMIDLEATFERLENELREVNTNEEMLKKNYLELTELKHILRKTQAFFDERSEVFKKLVMTEHMELENSLRAEVAPNTVDPSLSQSTTSTTPVLAQPALGFVAGVIARERVPGFERLLWRACRGNVFLRQAEITEKLEDPNTGAEVHKCVFIIFFQGDQLKTRVKKICEGYRASMYPCPETPQERREMAIGVMTRIEDLKTVLGQTQDHRHRVLVAAAKNVRMWTSKVRKLKAIYHTLNLFNLDVTSRCLVAECWCPIDDLEKIQMALKRGTEESGSSVPSILNRMNTVEQPPTFHRANKLTAGFQTIVDSYGMACYREINPAPFTLITFPFLFAVMFGDMGHGTIMLLFALFMVLREKQLEAKKIKDEIFTMFFGGRYVILLMGAFSIYTGFIYNDVFSKSLSIFSPTWNLEQFSESFLKQTIAQSGGEFKLMLDPNGSFVGDIYPLGLDPIWSLADNKLTFLNSFKMKMSVILGICQMTFGVFLSLQNYRFFKKSLDVYCVFLPQIIFLTVLFVYLCVLIIYKWLCFSAHASETSVGYYPGPHCAPAILMQYIGMFMFSQRGGGFVNEDTGEETESCWLVTFYFGQMFWESLFVLTAMVCAPTMLFAKPYILWKRSKAAAVNAGNVMYFERVFVAIAVVCVPWMLLTRPYLLYRKSQQTVRRQGFLSVHADVTNDTAQVVHNDGDAGAGGGGDGHGGDGPFDFGDTMVYSAIHTIEFCLGCISHTASYLRLWALSLAHAQLSDVLWTMVLRNAFAMENPGPWGALLVYVIFFVFIVLTVCVLVLMEGLSAFLHALRLHWVEFQSKFYGGTGYAFVPFSFDKLLHEAAADDE